MAAAEILDFATTKQKLERSQTKAGITAGKNITNQNKKTVGIMTSTAASKEVTDKDLVARVQAGDNTAFDLLVRKYQSKVVSLVSRYVNDPSEALDIAQESFIKAWRALPNFRGDSQFYTWIYRIAINTAKNYIASRGRQPSATGYDIDNEEDPQMNGLMKDVDTPEAVAMTGEIGNTVADAIEALPEDLREAIVLREIEGMSYEEIAESMSCPVGTVRSRLFRAREAIDQRLEPLLN